MKKRTALAICALLLVLALAGPAAAFPLPDFDLTIPTIPTPTPKPTEPALLQTVDPGAPDTPRLLSTSPSPRGRTRHRMPSSA